jgi:hypothetical protein
LAVPAFVLPALPPVALPPASSRAAVNEPPLQALTAVAASIEQNTARTKNFGLSKLMRRLLGKQARIVYQSRPLHAAHGDHG